MSKLKFNDEEFRKVLNASIVRNKNVHLVKDDGIYMMVFGPTAEQNTIAYAIGFNPKTDGDDVWDRARDAVGGDDFGEPMLNPQQAKAYYKGENFELEITETQFTLTMEARVEKEKS